MIYCGIDWAEKMHDVALVDDTGQLLAKPHHWRCCGLQDSPRPTRRVRHTEDAPIPIAIETSRGLLAAVVMSPVVV